LRQFNLLALFPFLLALMLRQWVTITLYDPLYPRLNGAGLPREEDNALYVLEAAGVLLLVCVALLPLFRRLWPLLFKVLRPKRIPIAALGMAIAFLALFGGLAALLAVGGGTVSLRWSGFGRFTALIIAGQALIAFAEEFYYRGFLQSELAFLLPALGYQKERARVGLSIGLVSLLFGLEHYAGWEEGAYDLRMFIFTFASSLFLGVLLVLMENLWFSAGCHFTLNMFVLGAQTGYRSGGLQFVDPSGQPLFDPAVYVFLFFILAFVVAYLRHALYAKIYRRRKRPVPASA
jgi:membrane protease YdiL (CAAX protease family)